MFRILIPYWLILNKSLRRNCLQQTWSPVFKLSIMSCAATVARGKEDAMELERWINITTFLAFGLMVDLYHWLFHTKYNSNLSININLETKMWSKSWFIVSQHLYGDNHMCNKGRVEWTSPQLRIIHNSLYAFNYYVIPFFIEILCSWDREGLIQNYY